MTEEYIKDYKTQKIIGIIRTEANGDKTAIDFASRKILGFYRKLFNTTVDLFGRVLATGDATTGLIWQNFNNK